MADPESRIRAQAIDPAADIERHAGEGTTGTTPAWSVGARGFASSSVAADGTSAAGGTSSAVEASQAEQRVNLATAERAYGVAGGARLRRQPSGTSAEQPGTDSRAASRGSVRGTARQVSRDASMRDGGGGAAGASAASPAAAPTRREPVGQRVAEGASSARAFVSAHPRLIVALLLMVGICVAFFGPVQRYYVSERTNQDLQLKYDTLVSQNKDLSGDVKSLMSKEGIEAAARKNGYVYKGETGDASNTTESSGAGDSKSSERPDPSAAITYKDNRAWYIRLLDGVFGYDRKKVLG